MTVEEDFLAAARDVLAVFGRAATWTTYVDVYDAATGTNTRTATAHGVTCTPPITDRRGFRPGATAAAGSATIYVGAEDLGFVPAAGQRVLIGTEAWSIVEVETMTARETPILYACSARKGAA